MEEELEVEKFLSKFPELKISECGKRVSYSFVGSVLCSDYVAGYELAEVQNVLSFRFGVFLVAMRCHINWMFSTHMSKERNSLPSSCTMTSIMPVWTLSLSKANGESKN